MVIDCHVHRYPPEVFANPAAFANSRGERHWQNLVVPEKGPTIQGWADRETMLADMDSGGVDKAVLLGWYWETPETCALHNSWHAEWMRKDPERFIAFAAINPLAEKAIDELKAARDEGFRGIGEILPAVQGFSMRDLNWLKIVEFAVETGWPINFHVSEPVGHPHPGRMPSPFEDFQWLAETYPELKIILAHWGGLLPFYELNEHVRKSFANVWYDVAASPLLYDSKVFRSVVDVVGSEKVLYGSDYPLRLYPGKQEKPDFSTFLAEIQDAGLTESEQKNILGDNASRLFGLEK